MLRSRRVKRQGVRQDRLRTWSLERRNIDSGNAGRLAHASMFARVNFLFVINNICLNGYHVVIVPVYAHFSR